MKCDPATIDELLARFPGAKSMGIDCGPGKSAGVSRLDSQSGVKPPGRRPVARKVGPNGENKTELDYYRKYLEPRLLAGEVASVEFESMKFKLTPSFGKGHKAIWYSPDFIVTNHDKTIEVHEIKGGWIEEDGHQKIKMFATKYPHITLWVAVRREGKWDVQRVGRD